MGERIVIPGFGIFTSYLYEPCGRPADVRIGFRPAGGLQQLGHLHVTPSMAVRNN